MHHPSCSAPKLAAKLDPDLEMYNDINGYLANVQLDAPTALSFDGLFDNEVNHYIDWYP